MLHAVPSVRIAALYTLVPQANPQIATHPATNTYGSTYGHKQLATDNTFEDCQGQTASNSLVTTHKDTNLTLRHGR